MLHRGFFFAILFPRESWEYKVKKYINIVHSLESFMKLCYTEESWGKKKKKSVSLMMNL